MATVCTPFTGVLVAAENWIDPLETVFGKELKAAPGAILTRLYLEAEYETTDCTVLIEAPPVSSTIDTTIFAPVVTVWLAGER